MVEIGLCLFDSLIQQTLEEKLKFYWGLVFSDFRIEIWLFLKTFDTKLLLFLKCC